MSFRGARSDTVVVGRSTTSKAMFCVPEPLAIILECNKYDHYPSAVRRYQTGAASLGTSCELSPSKEQTCHNLGGPWCFDRSRREEQGKASLNKHEDSC